MRFSVWSCVQNIDRGNPVALAKDLSSFDSRMESYESKTISGVFVGYGHLGPASNSIFIVVFGL